MTGDDFAALAAELRQRVPGLRVRHDCEPAAVLRQLPGWTPGLPWPRIIAAAPGLRGLAIRSDGTWAVEGWPRFHDAPSTVLPSWAATAAVEMVEAMQGRHPGPPPVSPAREILLRTRSRR